MNDAARAQALPAAVIDAAIDWAVKLDFSVSDGATRHAFEQWLQADPAHVHAWQRVSSLRDGFTGLPGQLALDTLHGVERAGALRRRQALKLLALGGIVTAVGWSSRDALPWQRVLADAGTAFGERRRVALPGGGSIVLNSDSAVGTSLVDSRMRVGLRRGEILVDGGVPLQVVTPFGDIDTQGARIDVRLGRDRARISVLDGEARMLAGNGAALSAGESWWLGERGAQPAAPMRFDPAGWVDGVIAARDIRLVDLLAELSRYRRGRIVCEDSIAERQLSGIYHIDDTDRALAFIAQSQALAVTYRTRFWVSVGPSSAA